MTWLTGIQDKGFKERKVRGFLKRNIHSDQNSPYLENEPLRRYSSIKRHFGNPTFGKEFASGTLYHRKNCDFLQKSEVWDVIYIDDSITPAAIMYRFRDQIFVERAYYNRIVKYNRKKQSHLDSLCSLSGIETRYAMFEKIIGYFLGDDDDEGLIYHIYSGGIPFDKINKSLSKQHLNSLQKILAKALRELNDQGIAYGECQPTNLRYKDNKIIFTPHNCISIGDLSENIHDVAAILYTNDWIQDKHKFCEFYLGRDLTNRKISRQFMETIRQGMEWLEIGDTCQMDGWLKRSLVNLPETYRNK